MSFLDRTDGYAKLFFCGLHGFINDHHECWTGESIALPPAGLTITKQGSANH